jgi:subtilisin family serine protease
LGISYLSVGIEPRYNIKEFSDDLALAVAAPATIGFAVVEAAGNEVNGASGLGNIQIPVLLKLYLGNGATYRTEKNMGLSLGAGLEYNRLPLLFQSNSSTDDIFRSGWIMPSFSAGLHIWRGNMPMEFNLKFGLGAQVGYSRDKNGEPIVDNNTLQQVERFSRAYSFKLTFVYPMSY